jgi:cytochrome c biogenesis protein CcdA/thiol-disulfide isomerase/thioredoxin
MLLIILAYLGGVLTILSPCILPVLPFVFARSGEPFRRSGLPLLCGMALTFALVATLAAVGGGWVVQANQYGRWLAIALMAFFGVTLLFPHLADRLTRPLVSMGDRLSNSARTEDGKSSVKSSFVLGIATGLLWAPCAGPILGLVLTGAALHGASVGTSLLLLAYAAGAATSLALALLIGGKLFTAMKRSLGAGEWLRRGLGVAMLCGVAAIALGLDTGLLTKVSTVATAGLEQKLLDTLSPVASVSPDAQGNGMMKVSSQSAAESPLSLPVEGTLPELSGAVKWLNSPPLTAEQLKGKVVLVDFWTYSCINCLRSLPYVNAWANKYHDQGLVVIGVHAPEFAFERDANNVQKAVHDLGINYPVALDNDFAIWKGFNNQYWPAHYFVDAKGQIRYHHFGEGAYAESEQVIQQLLKEAGQKNVSSDVVVADAQGVQKSADDAEMNSPETYLGYDRAENFASPGDQVTDKAHAYAAPVKPSLNQWGLAGTWTAKPENVVLGSTPGSIVYRFHARDLHLVLGPGVDGKPVRFRVLVDGAAPGANHGTDIAPDGNGTVTEQRLYQLVRQTGPVTDHTFAIEFLDPGVQAYAFTFG